jgi:predicted nucleic acid-binding protein
VLYVIDAGVAVKWFIPEEDSAIAHRLLERYLQGLDTTIAPDLLISECGNVFWRRCRQGGMTAEEATESIADLLTLNMPLVPASSLVQSALQLALRDKEASIMQIQEGLTAILYTGAEIGKTQHLASLVEINQKLGQFEEGFSVLADALALVETTEVRFYESELYRLKGELLIQQSSDNAAEAESCFQQAITIAQNQSAKSWELRAAMSFAKLWQQQGKCQEAYDLLAPVYG